MRWVMMGFWMYIATLGMYDLCRYVVNQQTRNDIRYLNLVTWHAQDMKAHYSELRKKQ